MIAETRQRIQRSTAIEQIAPVGLMERAGLAPDPWQRSFLEGDSRRSLMLCSRQSGKSTVTAATALHKALYSPGSLILLVCPTERQSKELLGKVLAFYQLLGEPIARPHDSTLHLTLANGSRILALPGNETTLRGLSGVDLLVLDEAAWVPDGLYYAVLPMLAVSNGRLIAMTTPAGKRGWFHQEWTEGGADFERILITAEQCPRISAEFLAEQRRRMPAGRYAAEYDCVFGDLEGAVFAYDDIMSAVSDEVQPLFAVPAVAQEDNDYASPLW